MKNRILKISVVFVAAILLMSSTMQVTFACDEDLILRIVSNNKTLPIGQPIDINDRTARISVNGVMPSDNQYRFNFVSSSGAVASVDDSGKITPYGEGTATYGVFTQDWKHYGYIQITVTKAPQGVPNEILLEEGEEYLVEFIISPVE